jgi:murein DD-endopeptidase MepM/ murein hydrolase activator NlpD
MKSTFIGGILVVLALLFGILFYFIPDSGELPVDEELGELAEEFPEEPTEYLYGLPVDSFKVTVDKIQKNEFLSHILSRFGLSAADIDQIAKKSKEVYSARKFKVGDRYTAFSTTDSVPKLAYFVYEPNDIDYVVFDLRDSLIIEKKQKEIEIRIRKASGVIYSSLSQTLSDQNISARLTNELADLYAWTIDFYRIQKGDYFQVIFEEKFIAGERIGIGNILAANFNNYGENNYAFRFDQGDGPDYFNEKAESLRRAFLQSPLKFGRLTSAYTQKRFHPVQKRYKAHLGTDYAAPTGTPIMAVGDGVVIEAKYSKFNGNYVKIRHNSTYTTQYLHMSKIGQGMRPGTRVRQGQTIGYVGSTGLATGPHVCYRFWKNGKQVDARKEKIPPSKPIKDSKREEFDAYAGDWKSKVDSIPVRNQELVAN